MSDDLSSNIKIVDDQQPLPNIVSTDDDDDDDDDDDISKKTKATNNDINKHKIKKKRRLNETQNDRCLQPTVVEINGHLITLEPPKLHNRRKRLEHPNYEKTNVSLPPNSSNSEGKRTLKCTNCRGIGHNSRTCPQQEKLNQ